jgi:undecaprenyl-diphosphatase
MYPAICDFDVTIVKYLNGFAGHSVLFDRAAFVLSDDHLLKGGVLMLVLWWAWFRRDEFPDNKREHILLTIVACFFALFISRILTYTLPFRPRPLYNESLHLVVPYGVSKTILEKWSSFPSDHASLFFALSTGFFFISKRIGLFSLAYSLLIICLPRIYIGLHYPSDILGGAVLGGGIALITNLAVFRNRLSVRVMPMIQSSPQFFYPFLFLVTYQIADNFETSREIVSFILKLVQAPFA